PIDGAINVYPKPIEPERITVRTPRVNQLLGTELTDADIAAYLEPLGIELRQGVATVPTSRPDVEREIDIVEEVARRIGLDNIAPRVPMTREKSGRLPPPQRDRRTISDALVGAGYDEVYTLPLIAPADLARAGLPQTELIEVQNPLRAEESVLRPAL